MITVSTVEDEVRWSELIDAVTHGDQVIITRQGCAIAKLAPFDWIEVPTSGDGIESSSVIE